METVDLDAIKGEEVVITENDQPVVRLVPFAPVTRRPEFGSAKGLIAIGEDFDAPLPDFDDYTRRGDTMPRDLKRRLDRLDGHRGQHTTIVVKYVEPDGTVANGFTHRPPPRSMARRC